MSDRPSAANGKRNTSWGTLGRCPSCGQCLCFGCHPAGPCVDETAAAAAIGPTHAQGGFISSSFGGSFDGAWLAGGASGAAHPAGLRMHCAPGTEEERLR